MTATTTALARLGHVGLWVATIAAAAAVAAGCGATSSATAEPGGEQATTDGPSETLALNGLTLTVPQGWDSESFINASGMSVFRAGTFTFPDRPDDDVGQIARALMGPNDVLVNIVDFTAVDSRKGDPYRPVTPPLTVGGSEAAPQEGYTVPAAVVDNVDFEGHKLYLSVSFGQTPPSDAQVAAANELLRTLSGS